MPTSTLYASVDICALRVALLNSGGAPDNGASNGYVDNSVRSLGVSIPLETGQDQTLKNGCGALLAARKTPDLPKGVDLDPEVGLLDAILAELLLGADLFFSSGDAIGFKASPVGTEPIPVCVEAWTKAWAGSGQAVDPFTTPEATYIHWVFPFVLWSQADFTLNEEFLLYPLTGVGRDNASITANGPFDDWPSAVANAGGVDTSWGWFFDDALPAHTEGEYVAVTSAAS